MAEKKEDDTSEMMVSEEIEFKMKTEQMVEKALLAANIKADLDSKKIEYKDVQQKWRDEISKKDANLTQVLEELKAGCERKVVTCKQIKNFTTGYIEYHHDGVCKKRRPMTDEDRQEKLVDTEDASGVSKVTDIKNKKN